MSELGPKGRGAALLQSISLLQKAYLCGFTTAIIHQIFLSLASEGPSPLKLSISWLDIFLAGGWSIAGFLGSPYALYKVLAFLPEQADLNGAARCFQSGLMYALALTNELKIINPLFAGAIYSMLVVTVVIRNLRIGKPWMTTATSWRLAFAATVVALCAIYAKDELLMVIGWRDYYCG